MLDQPSDPTSTPGSAPSDPSHGSDPSGGAATADLVVTGMHCGSCQALVEESLSERDGVTSAVVDLESGRAVVRFDPGVVTVDDLTAIVAEVGYSATPAG
jgi:Cu+-exporting ATPase